MYCFSNLVVHNCIHKNSGVRDNLKTGSKASVYIERIQDSGGGISNVGLLISIFSYVSTQGMIKNTQGPLAPPVKSPPSLNITARSYFQISFKLESIVYSS